MADERPDRTNESPPEGREARLRAALKANLARRKVQARRRAATASGGNEEQDRAATTGGEGEKG